MAERAKRSAVWKYFKYSKKTDMCTCEVIVSKNGKEERCVIV
jgi:hypothetical protein